MASTAEIIAVVAAGGAVAYVLLKRAKPKAAGPACADACKGMVGYELVACEAACLLHDNWDTINSTLAQGNSVIEADGAAYSDEVKRRLGVNNGLNGKEASPALTQDLDGKGTAGSYVGYSYKSMTPTTAPPFRYANGCEPYFGARGWSKCAAGTLDMYLMAVEAATKNDGWLAFGSDHVYDEAHASTSTVFETPDALQHATDNAQKDHDANDSHWYQVSIGAAFDPTPVEKLNKDNFGTGGSGDPLTRGPFVDDAGTIWWLVRGKRLSSPANQVPLAIAMRARGPRVAGQTLADSDAAIKALTDEQARSLIPVGSTIGGNGTGTRSTVDCTTVQAKDSHYTWDPSSGGFWRRIRAGETRNLGPCATATKSSAANASSYNASALNLNFALILSGLNS